MWPLVACTSSPPEPSCADPAPLTGTFDPQAPDYIVLFHDGVDPAAETARLEAAYEFTARHVYTVVLDGFSAMLDDDVRDLLRCEPTVKSVSHDAVVHGTGTALGARR